MWSVHAGNGFPGQISLKLFKRKYSNCIILFHPINYSNIGYILKIILKITVRTYTKNINELSDTWLCI
jgi:hypothetical protein